MSYEERRDAYLAHIRSCPDCVSTYNGARFGTDWSGRLYPARFAAVSQLCSAARALLDRIIESEEAIKP